MVNRILAIADLHCLSAYGLSPLEWQGEEGVIVQANEGQKRLHKYWSHLMETLREEKWSVEEVWVVGDAFAGLNPIERGRHIRGSFDEQQKAALYFLTMLPKDVVVKVWSGSAYHESLDVKLHRVLTEGLQAYGYKASYRGSWSIERIGKRKKAFVTHQSSSAVIYPHIPMLRDSRWFKIRAYDGKLPRVQLIVRAHKHEKEFIDDGRIKIVQLPAWQVYVPYRRSLKMFPMYQPDIGGVFIFLDEEDRIRVQEWLYPPFLLTEEGDIIETDYDPRDYVTGWE